MLALFLACSAQAKDCSATEALKNTPVPVDSGVLTAASETGMFRYDAITGGGSILIAGDAQ